MAIVYVLELAGTHNSLALSKKYDILSTLYFLSHAEWNFMSPSRSPDAYYRFWTFRHEHESGRINGPLLALFGGLTVILCLLWLGGILFTASIIGALICLYLVLVNPLTVAGIALTSTILIGSLDVPQFSGIAVNNIVLVVSIARILVLEFPSTNTPRKPKLPLLTFFFIFIVLISNTPLGQLTNLSTPMLIGMLTLLLVRRNPKIILIVLGVIGLTHTFIGLYESLTHTSLVYTSWKDSSAADINGIRRAASTVGDPNYLAASLLCTIPGIAYITRTFSVPVRGSIYLIFSAVLLLTFSRGALLAGLVGVLFYVILNRRKFARPSLFVMALTGGLLLIGFLTFSNLGQMLLNRITDSDASLRSRTVVQLASLEVLKDNWITGIGLGQLSNYLDPIARSLVPVNAVGEIAFLPQTDPLNTYLLIGAEGGILALGIAAGIVILAIRVSMYRMPLVAATIVSVSVAAAALDLLQSPVVWCLFVFAIHFSLTSVQNPQVRDLSRV